MHAVLLAPDQVRFEPEGKWLMEPIEPHVLDTRIPTFGRVIGVPFRSKFVTKKCRSADCQTFAAPHTHHITALGKFLLLGYRPLRVPGNEMEYSTYELIDRFWRQKLVWWILRCIPRAVQYYVIIKWATKDEDGNPGAVTAVQMLEKVGGR